MYRFNKRDLQFEEALAKNLCQNTKTKLLYGANNNKKLVCFQVSSNQKLWK